MPRKSPAPETAETSPISDCEAPLDALEQLVEKMEHGELSLEQSLAAYERGVGLYRRCQQALEQAELRVKLLSDPDNPASAEAFGPAPDGTLLDQSQNRSRKIGGKISYERAVPG